MKEFSMAHNKVFVSFSGGKDSVASFLKAKEQYPKEMIELVFCDTGDELPETYDYIRYFNDNVHPVTRIADKLVSRNKQGRRKKELCVISNNLPLKELRETYLTVFDEIKERFRVRPDSPPFPANGIRHCTTMLKINVFGKFVRSKVKVSDRRMCVVVIGLRKEESRGRADTPETSIDLVNNWDIWYPIRDFSLLDVLDIHKKNEVLVSESYKIASRSNCLGCPLSSLGSIKNAVKKHGEKIIEGWVQLEKETGYTFKNGKSILDYKDAKDEVLEVMEGCNSGYCDF